MERPELLRQLAAPASDDRLRAARGLLRVGRPEDVTTLKAVFAAESNHWVRGALAKAITTLQASTQQVQISGGADDQEGRILEQVHAEAVEDTTKRLIHELRPILGRLDVCAAAEIEDYESSRTKKQWRHLTNLLSVIDHLSNVAATPIYTEFELASLIDSVVETEHPEVIPIEVQGPRPLLLVGAASCIEMIVAQAIRNAVEATEIVGSQAPIVVAWGTTDRDYWVAVLDEGVGLPVSSLAIFEIGATTKKDHFGMGLALARQAAISMNGKLSLRPRTPAGTRFELRWPRSEQ